MGDLREKIKAVLDTDCRDRFRAGRIDARRQDVDTGGLPRCDNFLPFPDVTHCWMCHKNDVLAQEIEKLKES